ncbi:AbrB/MazE/SpoVT family DNA-binding domain-containing protein [Patescibacteria group bacterium]|nr:AbrB/MazE/SpoVT family DNA-binding domain-containing protein [Patescibacteria group bacterium]MBU4017385.1 AbrB/MazE/SpoVT family DNA-binding domain-containing protein [Patescibacteria group bacterium]MBU4098672.1 AbrB/MazE/SpoVT family DNA-binding domain-containing protein [Patescibacteria group bacterium]
MNIGTTSNYLTPQYKELQSTVTRKGQVTVPADVRALLGISKGDKVGFMVGKDKKVQFVKKRSVVAQTAGILKADVLPLTAEKLREEAELAATKEVMERSR